MATYLNPAAYDAVLDYIKTNSNAIVALNAEPSLATYADTQGAKKVSQGAVTSANFDVLVGEAGYARRLDFLGASCGTSATATTITYFALVDTVGSSLIYYWPSFAGVAVAIGSPINAMPKTSLLQLAPTYEEYAG